MIVIERPQGLRLLFTLKGSILGDILKPVAAVVFVSVLVTLSGGDLLGSKLHMHIAVFGMLGTVLAIILGFRTNTAYGRYSEGRLLWGEMLAGIRNVSRALATQVQEPQFASDSPERRLLCALVAMSHTLRHSLRGSDGTADIRPWIGDDLASEIVDQRSPASRLLDEAASELRELADSGRLTDFASVSLQQDLAFIQRQLSGCERLATTPIPFVYSLLVHRTIGVYLLLLPFGAVDSCGAMTPLVSLMLAYTFFGLEAVGTQIEEPFGEMINHLPLSALCRSIEIDLAPLLGHEPPAPVAAVDGVLS